MDKQNKIIQRFLQPFSKNLSIRTKIVFRMSLLIIAFGFLLSFIVIQNAHNEFEIQMHKTNTDLIDQFNNFAVSLQNEMLSISSSPYANKGVIDYLSGRSDAASEDILKDQLYSVILSTDAIKFIAIISPDRIPNGWYLAVDSSFGLQPYDQLVTSPILGDFISSKKDFNGYLLSQSDTSIIQHNSADKLLFIRTIKDPQASFKTIGYLLLGVDEKIFENNYSAINRENNRGVLVVDAKGEVLMRFGHEFEYESFQENQGVKYMDNGKNAIYFDKQNMLGWTTYLYAPATVAMHSLAGTAYTIIIIALTSVLVFIFITTLITSTITSPMKELLVSMKKFQEGDFNQNVRVVYNDEIGMLTSSYNQMVNHIKALVDQNYRIKLKEKESEMAVLEAQINPHFLYNTLDLIYWKAQSTGRADMAQDIYSLARLFRIALNRGSPWISIKDEKGFLGHYLSLQRSLKSDELDYEILIDDAILDYYTPHFFLQPLVENSIVHGLEHKLSNCQIRVCGKEIENMIMFTVEDNGIGMDEDQVAKVFSRPVEGSDEQMFVKGQGYAISNVLTRLDIYFNDQYSLDVQSEVGRGTKITVTIPKRTEPPKKSTIENEQLSNVDR